MTGDTVVVSDLDQTLIYSPGALRLSGEDEDAPRLLCVEVYQGAPLSFVTERAAGHLTALAEAGVLVPATTRTVEQYRRVHLPGPAPKFALCANGGRLLRDGVEDLDFTAAVTDRLATSGAPFAEMLEELHRTSTTPSGAAFVHKVRDASGLFCYVVVDRAAMPAGWVEELTGFARERAWGVSVQGRKVYCVPSALTKATAAREVADVLGAGRLVAAGDSLLDAELLDEADAAVRPRHGELADSGFDRPHVVVTVAEGVLAGEEIAGWLVEQSR
jgi:phosphoserine phosphatase